MRPDVAPVCHMRAVDIKVTKTKMNNKEKIIEYLKDGDWHCFANPGFFMKDDRTRISELRKLGYTFDERLCDGRCNVSHNSKLLMRRLVSSPQGQQKSEMPRRDRANAL